MDWKSARHWPKGFGLLLAALLLLSLLSFHLDDPTFTNLRAHSGGTRNLLGLLGALTGGSLLELLGSSALLAPLLLANWVLSARNRPPLHRYLFWCVTLLTGLAALHGLLAPSGDPGLTDPGLAGWAARRWVHLTTGVRAGALGLLFLTAYAAGRVLYQPVVRTGFGDLGLFAGWLLRDGGSAARMEGRKVLRGAGRLGAGAAGAILAVSGGVCAGLAAGKGVLLHPFRGGRRRPEGVSPLSLASAAPGREWKHSPARGGSFAGTAAGSATGSAAGESAPGGGEPEPDPFDAWFAPSLEENRLKEHCPEDSSREEQAREDGEAAPPRSAGPPPRPAGKKSVAKRADGEDRATGANPAGMDKEVGRDGSRPALPRTGGFEKELLELAAEFEGKEEREMQAGRAKPEKSHAPAAGAEDEAGTEGGEEWEGEDASAAEGNSGYVFERPEAESAWRERFQRYARNLDLDWQEQLWGRMSEEDEEEGEPETDPAGPDPQ